MSVVHLVMTILPPAMLFAVTQPLMVDGRIKLYNASSKLPVSGLPQILITHDFPPMFLSQQLLLFWAGRKKEDADLPFVTYIFTSLFSEVYCQYLGLLRLMTLLGIGSRQQPVRQRTVLHPYLVVVVVVVVVDDDRFLYRAILRSRADSLRSHVILHE